MKNLKKVLALVLVVAMMASFAVGASAAFKDADKITYTTAVDVLTGLGVINGYADGTFRATDSVTRGAFAKMTAYVMNGGVNAAASYGTYAAASFKDVAANSTFGNAIGYCTNKRIISGYSDGTFRAGNKVTGVQGAKMLLGALGYDSKIEGYTGSAWAKNVLADAEDAGLFKGMGSVDLTQPLTREAAAQMIWNALRATMVKYAVGGVTITTPDGTTVNTGASAAEPVPQCSYTNIFGADLQLAEKYFENLTVVPSQNDAYGRPTVEYRLNGKAIAADVKPAVKTYDSNFTAAESKALQKQYKVVLTGTGKTEFHYNGGTDANVDTMEELVYANQFAKTGYTIEFYADADNNLTDVVVIEGFLAKVGKVTTAKKVSSVELSIYEAGYVGTHTSAPVVTKKITDDVDKTGDLFDILTANYSENEYILVTCKPGWDAAADKDAADYILNTAKLDSVTGTVSRSYKGADSVVSTITMGGTTYKTANEFINIAGTTVTAGKAGIPAASAKAQGTLYLLPNGVAVAYVGEVVANEDRVILVTKGYSTLEDGQIVSKVEGIAPNGETKTLTVSSAITATDLGKIKSYTVDPKGVATLEDKLGDNHTYEVTGTEIKKSDLKITTSDGVAYLNSDVKFIFWNDTTKTASVVDGKQNAKVTSPNKMHAVVATKGGTKYVVAVYVAAAQPDDVTINSDSLVFVAASNGGTSSVVVNGEAKTVYGYNAYVAGEAVDAFFATTSGVTRGFYVSKQSAAYDNAYVLDAPVHSSTAGATRVLENETVATYAQGAGVMTIGTADYDVSGAKIVDLTTNETGLVNGSHVYVVYAANTSVVSYVYVVD